MKCYIQNAPEDEPVYQFIDKKRSEGKPYFVYMTAAANKFIKNFILPLDKMQNLRNTIIRHSIYEGVTK